MLRVTLQTSLRVTNLYKLFILFLHAHLLHKCVLRKFPSELLHVMRIKLTRRHSELGPAISQHLHEFVHDTPIEVETRLSKRWTAFQAIGSISPCLNPKHSTWTQIHTSPFTHRTIRGLMWFYTAARDLTRLTRRLDWRVHPQAIPASRGSFPSLTHMPSLQCMLYCRFASHMRNPCVWEMCSFGHRWSSKKLNIKFPPAHCGIRLISHRPVCPSTRHLSAPNSWSKPDIDETIQAREVPLLVCGTTTGL